MATESPIGIVADVLVTALESAPAQATLTELATTGEAALKTGVLNLVNNIKPTGVLALVWDGIKPEFSTAIDATFAKYTPAEIAAFITREAQLEAKALGG